MVRTRRNGGKMAEMIYGDNEEEFRESTLEEALLVAWDGATLDTEIYTVWEGELSDEWIDTGYSEYHDRVVKNVKSRTFRQVKNLDSEYFDFGDFVEMGEST